MGDGGAEWGLTGLFHIHMNELVISRAIGKLINAWLVDNQPLGATQFFANMALEVGNRYKWHDNSLE